MILRSVERIGYPLEMRRAVIKGPCVTRMNGMGRYKTLNLQGLQASGAPTLRLSHPFHLSWAQAWRGVTHACLDAAATGHLILH